MTKPKHVPECFNGRQRSGGLPCICNRLRACEQRVREEHATEWQTEQEEIHVLGLNLAYRKGLDAAREAVEKASSLLQPLGPALAAIDALKEEK